EVSSDPGVEPVGAAVEDGGDEGGGRCGMARSLSRRRRRCSPCHPVTHGRRCRGNALEPIDPACRTTMEAAHPQPHWLPQKLRHIANESAELPIFNLVGKPLYRRMFQRPFRDGHIYYGAYDTYAQAKAAAPAALPRTYAN